MPSHAVAAAGLCAQAACHLAAGGDRAGYWRLMGEVDLCMGRSAEGALQLATRYEFGLVDGGQLLEPAQQKALQTVA